MRRTDMKLPIFADHKPKRGLAMKGKPCIVLKPGRIPEPCSITLLLSLNTEDTFIVNIRYGSNTQANFFDCLKEWRAIGALLPGDILIMDNAAVHLSEKLGREIRDYCHDIGVAIQTLPTYSPELNPCELVFARIKNFMKSTDGVMIAPTGQVECMPFTEVLRHVLGSMSREDVENLYRHCAAPQSR